MKYPIGIQSFDRIIEGGYAIQDNSCIHCSSSFDIYVFNNFNNIGVLGGVVILNRNF